MIDHGASKNTLGSPDASSQSTVGAFAGVNKWLSKVDYFTESSGRIFSYNIFIIVFLLLLEVALRYFFNNPTVWVHEVSLYIFGAAGILAGAYCLKTNQHIRVDLIYNLYSPRVKAWVDSVTMLIIFFWVILYIYFGTIDLYDTLITHETSITPLRAPLWPIKLSIPLAGFLVLIQGIVMWIRSLRKAVTGRG